jgi:hypothetical protein
MKLFSALGKKTAPQKPIVIVSGLPRSGTSMMMKMLSEAGLSVVEDGVREKDVDNPNGYFEFESVKKLPEGDFTWLDHASGKAVKVISYLLEYLPSKYTYKVIFMEREIKEVLASQQKMLTHRKEENSVADEKIKNDFQQHLRSIKAWLVRQPNIEVLYINFNALMANPKPFCDQIVEFLNMPLDAERMLDVPNKNLYRNRAP